MAMKLECDCCGKTAVLYTNGIGANTIPEGWRAISTVVRDHARGGSFYVVESESAHSCDDCNSNMTVDEHLEAEEVSRVRSMEQKAEQ